MPSLKLTKRAIEQLAAPDPSGRQVLFWDTEIKGFGLLVSGATSAKTIVVQRKLEPSGNTRRVTVGAANVLDLDAARQQAKLLLAEFYAGVDPKAKRIEEKARGKTLREATEEYLNENPKLSESSRQNYRAIVHRHLSSWLDTPLRDIDRRMVERRHQQIAKSVAKPGRMGGGANTGGASADMAMRTLSAIHNFIADRDETMPPNPVRLRNSWFKVEPRDRILSGDQLPAFYAAVAALKSRAQSDLVKLMLFTGLRRTEASALRWAEVDLASHVIRLPARRTKAGRRLDLPMSSFVHRLLVGRRSVVPSGGFVFPARTLGGYTNDARYALELVAKASGITVSPHDLRRTFITHAEESDISVMALKALVNHSIGGSDVTENYARMTVERLREPAERVCKKLMSLCGVELPTGENVSAIT